MTYIAEIDGQMLKLVDRAADRLQSDFGVTAPAIALTGVAYDAFANFLVAATATYNGYLHGFIGAAIFVYFLFASQISRGRELFKDARADWSQRLMRKYASRAMEERRTRIAARFMVLAATLATALALSFSGAESTADAFFVFALAQFMFSKAVHGYSLCVLPRPPSYRRASAAVPNAA